MRRRIDKRARDLFRGTAPFVLVALRRRGKKDYRRGRGVAAECAERFGLCYRRLLWGKDFVAPGEFGGFFQGGGDGAIFFLGEIDGVFYGGFVKIAAEAEKD